MDDFSHLKCYWKTGALTYPESGREGGRAQLHQGCAGLVSTCKQRPEAQALLAVGKPNQSTTTHSSAVQRTSVPFVHLSGFYETFYSRSLPLLGEKTSYSPAFVLVPFCEMLLAKIAFMWPEALGYCCFLLTNTGCLTEQEAFALDVQKEMRI